MLRPRSLGLLLALITLLIYLPATGYRFINYDDPSYVTENPFVNQGLTWFGIQWAFTGAHAANWHPLTWISHMVDCSIFNLNPAGPHLVNILLHSLNAGLVFALLFRLTGKLWPAMFVGALFAWHPLHVESVAWIAERKDVLSTFFTLLTLLAYVRYVRQAQVEARGSRLEVEKVSELSNISPSASNLGHPMFSYALALFFFALALLSKPMPVTLPAVMLLLDFWPLGRVPDLGLKNLARLIGEKIPFAALAGAVCVITILAQHHAESSLTNIPLSLRLENAMTAYVGYLGKMIWPVHLSIFYPFHSTIAQSWVIQCALILIGLSAFVWLRRKANPWLLAGWLWFLITLLPVIGIVQVGAQALADRYTYFPLIGIFLAISFSMATVAEHFPGLKKWLAITAIFMLVVCISLTEKQLAYWHDSETLFTHALEVEPSDIAHVSLGAAFREQNRMREALGQYVMAWRLQPSAVLPNVNIAGILVEQGKLELAVKYFQIALEHNTWMPLANENYGRTLVTLKRYAEAEKQFMIALEIDPSQAQPHYLLGRLYLQRNHDVEAAQQFRECLRLEPDNLEITVLLASVLASSENAQARNGAEARALAERAVQLTHHQQPAALDVLAMSCAETGQFDQAIQIEQTAVKLAEAAGQKEDLVLLKKRLAAYQKHQPWRESFKKD